MSETPETPSPSAPGKRRVVVRGPVEPAESRSFEDDDESLIDQQPRAVPGMALPPSNVRRYAMTIPKSARASPHDPTTVVMKELSDDEMDAAGKLVAAKTSGGAFSQATEVVKLAIVEVDGRPVDHAEDEVSVHWARWSQRVKALLRDGFNRIHTPPDDETAAFLGSMTPV
jgi:hypothetical protein